MSLKVIGGEFGGRNLDSVKGLGTRPLLGQVREAIFNILGDWVEGKEVWDLFAGTGASGIEALSRGAARVWFVEKNNQALQVLKSNLHKLGPEVEARTEVVKADAWRPPEFLPEGAESEVRPDLVFLDPPYSAVAEDPTRSAYLAQQLLQRTAPGGVVVFHFLDGYLDRDDFDAGLDVEIRRWGKSAIAMLQARQETGESAGAGLVQDTAYE
ncbi:MAG: RsmD family RNA methyltransferase [Planctomycetes bacterium]|nr:RsmD family RNA methyltransferase [Planctomycetota bacterium]